MEAQSYIDRLTARGIAAPRYLKIVENGLYRDLITPRFNHGLKFLFLRNGYAVDISAATCDHGLLDDAIILYAAAYGVDKIGKLRRRIAIHRDWCETKEAKHPSELRRFYVTDECLDSDGGDDDDNGGNDSGMGGAESVFEGLDPRLLQPLDRRIAPYPQPRFHARAAPSSAFLFLFI
ncbi:MAG: hypothetical protein JSS82_03330 [Bacteroidetes bacterium]|nr:hypothetical protein [Bacteroidota bacterium]